MYATVYACIRRNTSKILPSCYCLKPVVKLTLSIWNDTIKLNILQGRLHKFYSDTRSEFYTLYRVCGSTDKDTKRVKWTLGVSFFVWQNVLTCIRSNHDKRRKEVFMPRKIRSNYMEKFKFVYNGRTFESKHKCCNFYGICYRSVMAYQNQYKCRTEEAITHFIELKKSKEIIFRNRKWASIKTCCEFYDINEASVKTDMWNRKCTPQEAIERAIEWKKAHEITYHGVKYPSLPQCCEELGINPISVRLYMEKNGVSSTRAITHYIKSKKQRIFAFRGKEYNSFTECCLAYGLNPKIVRSAAYRTKSSLPETLEKNVSHMEGCVPQESTGNDENSGNKVISKKRHRAKEPFFYEGEKYVSLGQCCEIYGINETSVRARAWRIHCTWEEAVKHFIEKSNADELKKIFVYKGKEYQSVAECCRKYDVRAASVRNRASSTGCSIEEALDHFIKKKIVTKKNEFVFRNKSYETLKECCEVYGVNANSVSSRKYRLGCSTDESLEHFIANKEIIEERIQKFTFKGTEYPSLRACCKKYGIEDACVRQRARDKNCSIEESFEHFMTRKRKKMLDNPEFDYHGTLYPSLKECCEKLKISKKCSKQKSSERMQLTGSGRILCKKAAQ